MVLSRSLGEGAVVITKAKSLRVLELDTWNGGNVIILSDHANQCILGSVYSYM
jgi:hypothetical protein